MPSPVTPGQFCAAVPNANADLCTRFSLFLSIGQYLCDLFSWFLNADGSISDIAKAEIAQFTTPTGMLAHFATTNVGSGWLLCDGSAVSRTTYATLFAAIGTRYGAGDGSTTFELPDGRSRSLIGAGTGAGLSNRDINSISVGEESHTMIEAELVAHVHTFTGPTDRGAIRATSVNQTCWKGSVDEDTQSTGGGMPFNVIHPCLIGYMFIKT